MDKLIETQSKIVVWKEFLNLQISENTRRSYSSSLKNFFRWKFNTSVTSETIDLFLSFSETEANKQVILYREHLITSGLSAATVNLRMAALRSFSTHAHKRGQCQFLLNEIKLLKTQTYKDTKGISVDLFRQLIQQIDKSTLLGKRDYAILRLLWDNALRRAEVCGLDRADFYPSEGRLMLKGKGRIDKEPLDLAPATVQAISTWLSSMGDSFCPAMFITSKNTRLSSNRLYEIVCNLAKSAGIDRTIGPHKIRHSSITALLNVTNGDVRAAQALSRHKDISTLIHYDDARKNLQLKSARTLSNLI